MSDKRRLFDDIARYQQISRVEFLRHILANAQENQDLFLSGARIHAVMHPELSADFNQEALDWYRVAEAAQAAIETVEAEQGGAAA